MLPDWSKPKSYRGGPLWGAPLAAVWGSYGRCWSIHPSAVGSRLAANGSVGVEQPWSVIATRKWVPPRCIILYHVSINMLLITCLASGSFLNYRACTNELKSICEHCIYLPTFWEKKSITLLVFWHSQMMVSSSPIRALTSEECLRHHHHSSRSSHLVQSRTEVSPKPTGQHWWRSDMSSNYLRSIEKYLDVLWYEVLIDICFACGTNPESATYLHACMNCI